MNTKLKEEFEKRFISSEMTQEQIEGAYSVLDWYLTSEAARLYWQEQFKLEQDEEMIRFVEWTNDHCTYKSPTEFYYGLSVKTTQELLSLFRNKNEK